MIVLDTNVVSEQIRPEPSPAVLRWFERQLARDLYLTAISVAELTYGAARLPGGRRRTALEATILGAVDQDFADRVLPFDVAAAKRFGPLVAERERIGRPIDAADGQIAAICLQLGAALATRNTRDFDGLGLTLVDPWEEGT